VISRGDGTASQVSTQKRVKQLSKSPPNEDLLELYALYKGVGKDDG
jgi:acyl-CoA-binding protein